MQETIKEIYENVTKLFNHIANNFIGQKYDKNLVHHLKHSIDSALRQQYPHHEFNSHITFNEYSHELMIDLNPDLRSFPKIGYKNYHTHNFIKVEKENTYFVFPVMECKDCHITISENGNLIDGDFSCGEFIIKTALE
jgi:hypothetical protein